MKPERWQQLDNLFRSALERPVDERAALLDVACAGDVSLRREVEALLAGHEKARSFMSRPAFEVEARSLMNSQAGLILGETVGRYKVLSSLGVGGMGEVYLAEDSSLNRKVALKMLPAAFTQDEDRVRRFQQEARAASALNHPNIITIYEIGEVDNRHFIATEFIDGENLRVVIHGSPTSESGSRTSGTRLKLSEILNMAIQTADALSAAHEAGIVHRDIKPENIMVRRRDRYIKVLDFGLAKLMENPSTAIDPEGPTRAQVKTSAGVVMGTVGYMSPEQARGERVDARTDVWSLGVVLYEMVAGCAPFERSTPSEVIASILEHEPPPLPRYARDVPAELERIVSKTLTKDREERYQTAKDVLVDLRRLKQKLEVEAEIQRTSQPVGSNENSATAITSRVSELATVDSAVAVSTSGGGQRITSLNLNKRGALIVLASVVVLAAFAYFDYSRYELRSRAGKIRSVAVLPFENQTDDGKPDYLSDGISESLINSLSRLPGVKVSARSSSFKYRGKEVDPQEAANALGVEAILTGRVLQRGDSLMISVELMDARDKTQVWGEQYNRRATDVLQVQAEISREIAENLRLRLTAGEQQQITNLKNVNPQAYDLLIKGRFTQRKGGPDNRKKAIEYYQQAISVDPTYARAYAELSTNYNILFAQGILDPKEFLPKAEAAARRALELDESLADAHAALAFVLANKWDWTTAERENKRAIELNPNLPEAHLLYSIYLTNLGRHDEAITEAKRARELDPLWPRTSVEVGNALGAARRYDEAIESLKKTLEMDQSFAQAHFSLGLTYVAMGRYTEAIAEYEEMFRLNGDARSLSGQIYLGAAYAKAGERGKAQEILKRLQTTREYVSPTELAILYAALGQREEAFASLEKAYVAHDLQLATLGIDVSFDSLRDDPRFKDLMRRVGLTP